MEMVNKRKIRWKRIRVVILVLCYIPASYITGSLIPPVEESIIGKMLIGGMALGLVVAGIAILFLIAVGIYELYNWLFPKEEDK